LLMKYFVTCDTSLLFPSKSSISLRKGHRLSVNSSRSLLLKSNMNGTSTNHLELTVSPNSVNDSNALLVVPSSKHAVAYSISGTNQTMHFTPSNV
jgi:hypothetical protein